MKRISARSKVRRPIRFLGIVLVMVAVFLAACQPAKPEEPAGPAGTGTLPAGESALSPGQETSVEASEPDPRVVAAHNRLGHLLLADLVKEALSKDSGEGNVVISPLSVALAVALAENGASGETALAIARAMQRIESGDAAAIDELSRTLNESNLALLQSLAQAQATGDVRLKVANALWHRLGLTLSPGYADVVRRYYNAEVTGLDFSAADSVRRINEWAERATEGLIPQLVDELSDDLAALLANAVYFQGDWQTPFDESLTRPHPFQLPSGERPDVDMMYRSGSIEYYEGSFQAVRLPYGEAGRLAMYLFLPAQGESIEAFVKRFEEAAGEAFGNFRALEGEVLMPRLEVSYKTTLNEPLQRLGMGVAFDPTAADFSRMFPGARPGDFYVGDVVHQTVLKVDETGTEAAAVTTIEIRLTSVPVRQFSFRADRPFALAIRDDATGAILFAGAIVDPRS